MAGGMAVLMLCFGLLLATDSRAEPFSGPQGFDQQLIADVTGAALAFMLPRTLDAIPASTLSLWGLRGLSSLDPRLSAEVTPQAVQLSLSGRLLVRRAAPADDDALAWGAIIAQLSRAGWDTSEGVRRAGTPGIVSTFFAELFSHLDPYSRYASPGEAAVERARRNGRAGLGLELLNNSAGFVVRGVVAASPASAVGIKPGDQLLSVDGLQLTGAKLEEVNELLAGPEDSIVSLTLRTPGQAERNVEMTRITLTPPTVFVRRDGDIVVIRIANFARDTAQVLALEISRAMAAQHPPKGVVFDLRGNRGGLLRQAVAAAETVLASGQIAVTSGRDPAAASDFAARGIDLAHGLPLVVLVDAGTASAAEVLAAALADQRRAVVVGSATYGKGVTQTIRPLPDGGAISLTWSRVMAPRGWPLQALGVLPQLCTSLGDARLRADEASLARGVQPLAGPLARSRAARASIAPDAVLDIRLACPASDGRELDLAAARFLIATPAAYATALMAP